MELLVKFRDYIFQHELFHEKDKLLLAVSGGVDSVALCALCKAAGFHFSIAHCNFQLRSEESERDESFVKELSQQFNVAFYAVKFDTTRIAKERKMSIQETARDLRYEWFEEIRSSGQYHYILTAHHADDNIETVVMNFFRGTGIKGLKGIEPKNKFLVRPLLFARRKELEDFLESQQLTFVTDGSNAKEDYTRNYFRLHVLPSIAKVFPQVNENLLDNIARFRDVVHVYQEAMSREKKRLIGLNGNELHIPVLKLLKTKPVAAILYEVIKDYGFSSQQINDVMGLLHAETGKYVQSSTHRIIKNRNWLIIAPNSTEEAETILIESVEDNVKCSAFNIQFSIVPGDNRQLVTGSNIASMDATAIKFPLLLRRWKQGDYFYPLGMKKKKKLARFFIDQKLSKTEKENVWVIEMDKKILWVVGHRIDDRFKVTDKTESILRVSISNGQPG